MTDYTITPTRVQNRTFYPRIAAAQDPTTISPTALPTARVSVDDSVSFGSLLRDLAGEFATVNARFPIEYLEVMENLSLVNPDVSQAVDNIVQLGNTGHRVLLDGVTDRAQDAILDELNRFQQTVFSRYGGADGFVNALLAQIARGGAASAEWVVADQLNALRSVVLVPLRTIRFVYDPKTATYRPYQKVNELPTGNLQGLIPLNDLTYQYCALQLLDSSPYAVPPILAALESIMVQRDIVKNFRFVAKKMGLLGFITMLLKEPSRRGGETDAAYLARCKTFLADNAEVMKHNYRDGIALGFKNNLEVQTTSLMGSAQGAAEIMKVVEEQVFSGLKADPALHGRTYSTTETYAGVVYEKMLSSLTNYQRSAKAILEYGYQLHLTLQGYSFGRLVVEFEPSKSLTAERDETTYQTKLANLITLYNQGVISQETLAQEAGYDHPDQAAPRSPANASETAANAFHTRRPTLYRFCRRSHRYARPAASGIGSASVAGASIDPDEPDGDLEALYTAFQQQVSGARCGCPHHGQFAANDPRVQLERFMRKYFRSVFPTLKQSQTAAVDAVTEILKRTDPATVDSALFADVVMETLVREFGLSISESGLSDAIRKSVQGVYSYYRLQDLSPFGGEAPVTPSFSLVDRSAVSFLRASDNFYFGRQVADPTVQKSLKKWLADDFLQSGRSLRDPGELAKFRQRFGDRVAKEDYRVLRVVETSVVRAKNWGNAFNAEQQGVTQIEIAGPLDNKTCAWCRSMVGKQFTLSTVVNALKDVIARDPADLPQMSPFLPGQLHPDVVKATTADQLAALGVTVPPYHPHCRHRFIATQFG